MKLQYLTTIFVVLVPFAKATGSREYFNETWLEIGDDACKKTCSQTDALCSPTINEHYLGVKTCTVKCSCDKTVKLPDNTSCDVVILGSEGPGECLNGSCEK